MSSSALDTLLSELGGSFNFSTPSLEIGDSGTPPRTAPVQVPLKGRLCLNMIVKNESRIIERLLGSVLSIIDTYCICDTGSTDDTKAKIVAFMTAAGKPGEVFDEPFRNFGYNRTVALERAARWGTYALLLDADMKLVVSPTFSAAALTENGYSILQKSGPLEYYNMRIVKTGIGVRCMGPTHEYYDFPSGGNNHKVSTLVIDDIGDGGAKADKYERDVRLLLAGIAEEPKNERYYFYLANSYKDSGRPAEAINMYKKRIALGGWVEEVFYACYELGNMYKAIGDIPQALYYWLEGYNVRPCRTESLYEVTKYYREVGKNAMARVYCDIGLRTPFPKNDVLFIKRPVYDYLFLYEHSILAYYNKVPVDHYRYLDLIGTDYNKGNVLSNYRFYKRCLKDLSGVTDLDVGGSVTKTIGGRDDDFVSSSPCIVPWGDGYLLNTRYVNYRIQEDGSYKFKHDDGKITTLQRVQWLHRDFRVLRTHWLDAVHDESLRYQGVEDVKMITDKGEILFLGTVEDKATGRITVGGGVYDTTKDRLLPTSFASPTGRVCEKNWCYFHTGAGDLRVVYEWSPLTIGTIQGGGLSVQTRSTAVPLFFRDVRGSSNGCLVGDDIWFLCHLVEYSTPRHYYHLLIVLDAATSQYKRHSILFTFHGDPIEYALGLVVEPTRLVVSYSRMDRTSAILTLPREVVERELFPVRPAP